MVVFPRHVITLDLDCDVSIVYCDSSSTDYTLHTDYPLSTMSAVIGGFRSSHFRWEGDSSGVLFLYTVVLLCFLAVGIHSFRISMFSEIFCK